MIYFLILIVTSITLFIVNYVETKILGNWTEDYDIKTIEIIDYTIYSSLPKNAVCITNIIGNNKLHATISRKHYKLIMAAINERIIRDNLKIEIKDKNKLILETQKLTIQFLKKEKIYEKYMFYFKKTDHTAYYILSAKRINTFADYVKYEMEAYPLVTNLLYHAFDFSLTKEGSDFWLQKSILLKTYVENESNKTIHTIPKRKQSL